MIIAHCSTLINELAPAQSLKNVPQCLGFERTMANSIKLFEAEQ